MSSKSMLKKKITKTNFVTFLVLMLASCFAGLAFADNPSPPGVLPHNLGDLAGVIMTNFKSFGKLMIAVSYIAGFGFLISGIFKLKQHRDAPAQVQASHGLFLVVIGISLIFLPTLINISSGTGELVHAGGFSGGGVEHIPGGNE